jgi:hypothetical protein
MASWLTRLSAAFVVAGSAMAGYVTLKDPRTAAELQPALAQLERDSEALLKSLAAQAERARVEAPRVAEALQAQLPFLIIEPKDIAAPVAPALRVPMPIPPEVVRVPAVSAVQSPMDIEPVEARLRARVPGELFKYFDLYLYVSKATPDKGHWAQRMFVLAKQPDETMRLLHLWPVSTGKEEVMVSPSGRRLGTHTPQGMFKLDRGRFYEDYTSRQWKSPMPNAMFFDWQTEGRPSGLAIHGSDDQGARELGNRASHGCIRLSAENAKVLFDLIQANYKGRVPVFAIDPNTGTMSTAGRLVRDEKGRVITRRGYKVLVFIEDYGGPSVDTVAALY